MIRHCERTGDVVVINCALVLIIISFHGIRIYTITKKNIQLIYMCSIKFPKILPLLLAANLLRLQPDLHRILSFTIYRISTCENLKIFFLWHIILLNLNFFEKNMTDIAPHILAHESSKILSILKNIIENEGSNPLISYPVLIGSRAAKWHVPSFREPNDWDLVATSSQSASFINKVISNAAFKDIKLIHYPGVGLKIVGNCVELLTYDADVSVTNSDQNLENSIGFDIELVSDKVNLRKIKSI